MRRDEQALLDLLRRRGTKAKSALEIAESIEMPYNRARYLLRDKWPGKGWYEYGVSWRVGWLTELGKGVPK